MWLLWCSQGISVTTDTHIYWYHFLIWWVLSLRKWNPYYEMRVTIWSLISCTLFINSACKLVTIIFTIAKLTPTAHNNVCCISIYNALLYRTIITYNFLDCYKWNRIIFGSDTHVLLCFPLSCYSNNMIASLNDNHRSIWWLVQSLRAFDTSIQKTYLLLTTIVSNTITTIVSNTVIIQSIISNYTKSDI